MGNTRLSQEIIASGEKMMQMVREGKIHMHIMGNSSLERYGDLEHKETVEYGDFIKTKFCYDLMNLMGVENHE